MALPSNPIESPQLTDAAMISARISALGLQLRIDHAPVEAQAAAISLASEEVAQYLVQRFPESQFQNSMWVRNIATTVAIYWLCTLRNNMPNQAVKLLYDTAIDTLKQVQRGQLLPPGLRLPPSRPGIIKTRVRYDQYPNQVVEQENSTLSNAQFPQLNDPTEPNSWNTGSS